MCNNMVVSGYFRVLSKTKLCVLKTALARPSSQLVDTVTIDWEIVGITGLQKQNIRLIP